jgi:hypothetical protein
MSVDFEKYRIDYSDYLCRVLREKLFGSRGCQLEVEVGNSDRDGAGVVKMNSVNVSYSLRSGNLYLTQ